jgi:hypothetical protein
MNISHSIEDHKKFLTSYYNNDHHIIKMFMALDHHHIHYTVITDQIVHYIKDSSALRATFQATKQQTSPLFGSEHQK